MTNSDEAPRLALARAEIGDRIATAAIRAGRDPADIDVVAVAKTVTPGRIRAAIEAGFRSLGENRVQERAAKAGAVAGEGDASAAVGTGAIWHLVGPLQSNKARRAIELFDVVQTIDSLALAERLDRIAGEGRSAGEGRPDRRLRVLLQVNVDDDASKSGFEAARLERDLDALLGLPNLEIGGLMTVGRQVPSPEDARPTFAALRALSERLRARDGRLGSALSMGMSDDYAIAVEEGATIVRIGRAVFGARPTAR